MRFINFLIIVFLLFINQSKAQNINIYNCLYVSDGIWDPKKEDWLYDDEVVYSNYLYEVNNTEIVISKTNFKKNYKSWGWDKAKRNWLKQQFNDGSERWTLMGAHPPKYSTSIKRPDPEIVDPWLKKLSDEYSFIHLDVRYFSDIDKLTKAGAKVFRVKKKDIWSIDTNNGIVTKLWMSTDEAFEQRKIDEFERESRKGNTNWESNVKQVYTRKYFTESYAGDILVANNEYNHKLIIDFSDLSIRINSEYGNDRFKCTTKNQMSNKSNTSLKKKKIKKNESKIKNLLKKLY